MLLRGNGNNEEIENIAMIGSYIDYLMNLEENKSPQLSDARPISRWREFGLQKEMCIRDSILWSPPGAGCLKELVERTEEGPAKIRV